MLVITNYPFKGSWFIYKDPVRTAH
jgi:hypothetical protein